LLVVSILSGGMSLATALAQGQSQTVRTLHIGEQTPHLLAPSVN
jgi:hypothetical protein